MEYRKVAVGFDIGTGLYFVCDSELKHLAAEARSLGALRRLNILPHTSYEAKATGRGAHR
jgi:hypothetical protein